jgi:hypothetical protein
MFATGIDSQIPQRTLSINFSVFSSRPSFSKIESTNSIPTLDIVESFLDFLPAGPARNIDHLDQTLVFGRSASPNPDQTTPVNAGREPCRKLAEGLGAASEGF